MCFPSLIWCNLLGCFMPVPRPQVLECFVKMLDLPHKHRAGYLRLISELCWCQGVGITKTQNFICKRLLLATGASGKLRELVDLRFITNNVEVYASSPPMSPRLMNRSVGAGGNASTAGEHFVHTMRRLTLERSASGTTAVGRTLNKVIQGVQIKNLFRASSLYQNAQRETSIFRTQTSGDGSSTPRKEDIINQVCVCVCVCVCVRPLLTNPRAGGGGRGGAADRPNHPHQKNVPPRKMEFTTKVRHWRPILSD